MARLYLIAFRVDILVGRVQVQELEQHLPAGCRVKFEDPNALHDFVLSVCPEEGFWQGGKFKFHIKVRNTAVTELCFGTSEIRTYQPMSSGKKNVCKGNETKGVVIFLNRKKSKDEVRS